MNIIQKIVRWVSYRFRAEWTETWVIRNVFDGYTENGDEVYLEERQQVDSRHIERPARWVSNDILHIFDGEDGSYITSIIE